MMMQIKHQGPLPLWFLEWVTSSPHLWARPRVCVSITDDKGLSDLTWISSRECSHLEELLLLSHVHRSSRGAGLSQLFEESINHCPYRQDCVVNRGFGCACYTQPPLKPGESLEEILQRSVKFHKAMCVFSKAWYCCLLLFELLMMMMTWLFCGSTVIGQIWDKPRRRTTAITLSSFDFLFHYLPFIKSESSGDERRWSGDCLENTGRDEEETSWASQKGDWSCDKSLNNYAFKDWKRKLQIWEDMPKKKLQMKLSFCITPCWVLPGPTNTGLEPSTFLL